MSIELVKPSKHLILCGFLLLPPSIFPSIRVFFNELTLHIKWSKYWSFSFRISPSSWYSGLISFRIDCFDLLAIQGTLKSLFQTAILLGVYGPILTRLLLFVPTILIPACDSPSHAFRTMYFTYKLNRWGGNIQAWCIPFPILNYSVIQCRVLFCLDLHR